MALCSLSTGSTRTRPRASRITSSPAITSGSLLAMATSFPARMAARVGASPAPPTIAESTRSTSGRLAIVQLPFVPSKTSIPSSEVRSRNSLARCRSNTETYDGWKQRICCSSRSMLLPAASPTTVNRSRCCWTISRVLTPTEPVEPRIANLFVIVWLPLSLLSPFVLQCPSRCCMR